MFSWDDLLKKNPKYNTIKKSSKWQIGKIVVKNEHLYFSVLNEMVWISSSYLKANILMSKRLENNVQNCNSSYVEMVYY